ncbi:MAG: hypothetical protein R2932_46890 [Caldilineaceae bacterium]
MNQSFAAADFDRDGDLDFVVSSVTNNRTATNCEDLRLVIIAVPLGYVAIQLDTAAAGRLAFNDLDLDGDLDVVSTGLAGDYTRTDDHQSRGLSTEHHQSAPRHGILYANQCWNGAERCARSRPADLNNDGLLDIALRHNRAQQYLS